jgi:hypothetical protein
MEYDDDGDDASDVEDNTFKVETVPPFFNFS